MNTLIATLALLFSASFGGTSTAQAGQTIVLEVRHASQSANQPRIRISTIDVLTKRFNAAGLPQPSTRVHDGWRMQVRLPAKTDTRSARELIERQGRLELRFIPELDNGTWRTEPETVRGKETGYERIIGHNGPLLPSEMSAQVFAQAAAITGERLLPKSRVENGPKGPLILFEFDEPGKKQFEQMTRTHIGKHLAIFLDRRLISAPIINEAIPGKGILEGRFTDAEARTIAALLNSGPLAVALKVTGTTTEPARR